MTFLQHWLKGYQTQSLGLCTSENISDTYQIHLGVSRLTDGADLAKC